MAKIQKYNINPNPPITYKCDNSDYIKVTELNRLLKLERNSFNSILKRLPLADLDKVKEGKLIGKIEYIDTLLAAIDTEEK